MFLYFTKKDNGKIKAVYSGRFAFIADKITYKEIENAFNVVKDSANQNYNESNKSKFKEVQEEFLHYKIFKKNLSSLFINGLRYITRLIWRIFENKKIVSLYYEYRTLFYFIMYKPQEKLVDEIRRKKLNNINIYHFFKLLNHDLKLIKLLFNYNKQKSKSFFGLFVLLLASPFLILIGFIISSFFTIVIYEKENNTNNYKHKYISKYGIIKDLNRKNTIKSSIGELVQMEKIIKAINNFDEKFQNIKWLIIKYKTENEVYNYLDIKKYKFKNNNYDMTVFDTFENYYIQSMMLAFTWADINPNDNMLIFYEFQKIIQDGIHNDDYDRIKKYILKTLLDNPNLDLNRVIEFFYMHGN